MVLSLSAGAAAALAAGSIGSSAISAGASMLSNSNRGYNRQIAAEDSIFNTILQYNYQRKLAEQQFQHNSALAAAQFNYNKYFTEHGHQAEVADLRKAGLNPVLSANNGAYSQAGLASVGQGSIGQGDVSGATSALEQADVNRAQLGMTAMDVFSNVNMRRSTSALQQSEARVNDARVHNVRMDTELKASQIALNNIETSIKDIERQLKDYENLTKEERFELEKKRVKLEEDKNRILDKQADAALIGADAQKTSAISNAEFNERRSGGHSNSWGLQITPFFKFEHSHVGDKPEWRAKYETLPNGKTIKVYEKVR